ncbi:L,D-transpeptidase family protein [Armatimonas rosea]|uniref:Murein L,D-transpeptidase YafK n=1 Tax=Armatimonas rosea TaxID=685828 RepID=A0A7W9W563_ARMRO|nr:L,D-transpeptidase family protein [Armatimonas rosea]MBB6048257.1 murein L,D-transpeptidase YafK [Armatimonas rosea]
MQRTLAEAMETYGPVMRRRFVPACKRAGIAFPPKRLLLLAFKDEKSLEVWGANGGGRYKLLTRYSVQAASGSPGVKRRQGDRQVPEGFYKLTALNPSSRFHLSFRVDYPNKDDLAHATVPREQLGGDIYVHGNCVSIGCLALGDASIEELFPLVATVGLKNSRIWIAPCDLRSRPAPPADDPWVARLYQRLTLALKPFRR